eukprot:scaffold3173_cov242-Pinguiococcus_pyrenoidosus.AAC.5
MFGADLHDADVQTLKYVINDLKKDSHEERMRTHQLQRDKQRLEQVRSALLKGAPRLESATTRGHQIRKLQEITTHIKRFEAYVSAFQGGDRQAADALAEHHIHDRLVRQMRLQVWHQALRRLVRVQAWFEYKSS